MDPNYYETFDSFNPVVIRKEKKPLIDETQLLQSLPFETAGPIEQPYGPLNVGLTQSHNVPSNTHRRFKEMDAFYSSIKHKTGEDNLQQQLLREAKENDKKMKHEIHRDHIAEMFGGANFSKEPIKSEFADNFGNFCLTSLHEGHGGGEPAQGHGQPLREERHEPVHGGLHEVQGDDAQVRRDEAEQAGQRRRQEVTASRKVITVCKPTRCSA